MDHSTLHKTNIKKRNAGAGKRITRRSLVQKENRDTMLEKHRNLSPVKEKIVLSKNQKGFQRKEQLKVWLAEQKKKKEQEKKKHKPLFKVTTNVKHDDNLFSLSRKPLTAKEPESATKNNSKPQKEAGPSQKTKPIPAMRQTRRMTASKRKAPIQKKKRDKTMTKKIEATVSVPPSTVNDISSVDVSEPAARPSPQKESDSTPLSEATSQPLMEATEVASEVVTSCLVPTVRKVSDSAPLSESFAPTNFEFKAPIGLKQYQFDVTLPQSNDSFISKEGQMNFISSTPALNTRGSKRPKTPIPMVLSSQSASSSDEDTVRKTTANIEKQSLSKTVENKTNSKTLEISEHDKEKVEKLLYFRKLITTESENLTSNCKKWEDLQELEKDSVPEEVIGEIRSVIGQAQLLMSERFVQFSGLIDKYETPQLSHNPVTPEDLKGFWEMIYYQVDDVVKKFQSLENLKKNNWKKVEEETKKVTKKRKVSKSTKGSSAHRRAARQRIKAARDAMKAKLEEQEGGEKKVIELSGETVKMTADIQSTSGGVMTRSRRKTPGGKNVSFVSPRRKRKARFAMDDSEDESETPGGTQPRKRVMRKTPLPGSKSDNNEDFSSGNEDPQASPSFKNSRGAELNTETAVDPGEMKGMKLNFDDIESDGEDGIPMKYLIPSKPEPQETETEIPTASVGIDQKYLIPSVPDMSGDSNVYATSGVADRVLRSSRKSSHDEIPSLSRDLKEEIKVEKNVAGGIDRKYLLSSVADSLDHPNSPIPRDSLSCFQVPTKSPCRVLRSGRKSFHNPISPFLPKASSTQQMSEAKATDLICFSPLPAE